MLAQVSPGHFGCVVRFLLVFTGVHEPELLGSEFCGFLIGFL